MNVHSINGLLLDGRLDVPGLFPKIEELSSAPVGFEHDFGLSALPEEPGLIMIRGGRQLGKSTWLELRLRDTIRDAGAGSAFFLNCDEISDQQALFDSILELTRRLSRKTKIKRIFIDEITAVKNWEKAIKRLADQGITRDVLIVTTGSKTIDLRRGTERLPGRKGKLDRTSYRFTPVSFSEFGKKAGKFFKGRSLLSAYCITGGSPVAINGLIKNGKIPEYAIELTRDWIFGETSLQGRSIESLKMVIRGLMERSPFPLSLHVLAEDAALANNTVAHGYIELLKDLGCLGSSMRVEANKLRPVARKASKYNFTYLLAATAFHPAKLRTLEDFDALPGEEKGKWYEWLVAGELWRRAAIAGEDSPEQQYFWKNDEHEIDFVHKNVFIEVKSGRAAASEFMWFPKIFPHKKLSVICDSTFDTGYCESVSMEKFLDPG
ncbi:MAG: hypothetical protein A2583_08235 [Bdellovibrionales bacterium RIFOXYD1_FULL_53_11]|nr:MAG: hypothetical protein A2583_08235 [Bdellovibrionales bacterium RIFOXYD1_FULL_53_11]